PSESGFSMPSNSVVYVWERPSALERRKTHRACSNRLRIKVFPLSPRQHPVADTCPSQMAPHRPRLGILPRPHSKRQGAGCVGGGVLPYSVAGGRKGEYRIADPANLLPGGMLWQN